MEQFFTMLQVQMQMAAYFFLGYLLSKKNIISRESRRSITDLVLTITLPCTIFISFQQTVSVEQIRSLFWSFLAGLGLMIFSWLLCQILYRKRPAAKQPTLKFGTLISNYTFAGLPVAEAVYGSIGLMHAAIFSIPMRICNWTVGLSLFTQNKGSQRGDQIKNALLNPCFMAVIIGLLWMLASLPLPAMVGNFMSSLGSCTTPLSMMIVGTVLADVPLREVWDKDVLYLTGVRLILLPALTLLCLRLLGFDPIGESVAVVLAAMPVASLTVMFSEKYGADAQFASKCVVFSTLLSLITVPLFVLLMQL